MTVSWIVVEILYKDVKRNKEAVGNFKYCFIEYSISKNVYNISSCLLSK